MSSYVLSIVLISVFLGSIQAGELKPLHGVIRPPSMEGAIGCEPTEADKDVKWFRNGVELKSDSKQYTIERYPENSTVHFIYAGRDEIGTYVCKEDEDTEVAVTLSSSPYVYHKRSINLNYGNTLQLECRGFGIPEPNVRWFRAEQELDEDGKRVKFVNTTAMINGLLIIKDLEATDYSEYKCMANNTYGSYNSTTLVRVKSPYRAIWPILGIVIQLITMAVIILVYERRKKKSE